MVASFHPKKHSVRTFGERLRVLALAGVCGSSRHPLGALDRAAAVGLRLQPARALDRAATPCAMPVSATFHSSMNKPSPFRSALDVGTYVPIGDRPALLVFLYVESIRGSLRASLASCRVSVDCRVVSF